MFYIIPQREFPNQINFQKSITKNLVLDTDTFPLQHILTTHFHRKDPVYMWSAIRWISLKLITRLFALNESLQDSGTNSAFFFQLRELLLHHVNNFVIRTHFGFIPCKKCGQIVDKYSEDKRPKQSTYETSVVYLQIS